MPVLKIVLFGIIAAFCAFSVREIRSNISVIIGIAAGVIVLIMIADVITGMGEQLEGFFVAHEEVVEPLKSVVKIVLTGFIGDLSCSIIEDCGQKSLSDKVALAVRVMIIVQIIPTVKRIFEIVNGIL